MIILIVIQKYEVRSFDKITKILEKFYSESNQSTIENHEVHTHNAN